VFDWITHLVSGNPWTYVIVAGIAFADVLFPLLPSETVVLTAAVLAAQGALLIWLVVVLAAVGAFAGDNACWLLGDRVCEPVARRLFRGEKGRQRLRWAERAVRERGPVLILVGRFIPGGRTASTFAAGSMGLPWPRFALADAVAAVSWAVYVSMLGYLGGAQFRHSLWQPLLIGAGVALLVGLGVEVARRIARRRGHDLAGGRR
jgi:membrane protein DedA with SNARE-associated domain